MGDGRWGKWETINRGKGIKGRGAEESARKKYVLRLKEKGRGGKCESEATWDGL